MDLKSSGASNVVELEAARTKDRAADIANTNSENT